MENFVSVTWVHRSNLKLLNYHQQWDVNLDYQPKMSMAQGKIHFNVDILAYPVNFICVNYLQSKLSAKILLCYHFIAIVVLKAIR